MRIRSIFLFPRAVVNTPIQNYYNSAMTVIAQDDHLTAGAKAACGLIDNRKLLTFNSPS